MKMEAAGRSLTVFPSDSGDAPLVVVNTFGDEGGKVYDAVKAASGMNFSFLAVSGLEWNRDMSPWDNPPVFKREPPFRGGADSYLKDLVDVIIPAAVDGTGIKPSYKVLAGYSLAGLFAIYSMYRTDVFSRIASASGSLWFPGITEFVRDNEPLRLPERLYLSLGDRESGTRDPVMSKVGENTSMIFEEFGKKGVETVYETNPGNHFSDPEGRMAKAIVWSIRRCICSASSSPAPA